MSEAPGREVDSERPFAAFERVYLRTLLDRADGNISAAARSSELDRRHLRTLLRKHGLIPDPGVPED